MNMAKPIQIAALAGVAGTVFLAMAVVMPFTLLFIQVPLIFAGMVAGATGLLVAAVGPVILILVGAGVDGLMAFCAVAILPCIAIHRLFETRPPTPERPIWGDLYVLLSVVAFCAIIIGSLVVTETFADGLRSDIATMYQGLLDPESASEMADLVITYLPAGLAITWILQLMLNTALAGLITNKMALGEVTLGRLRNMQLPRYWDVIVAVIFLATFLPGSWGQVAVYMLIPAGFGLMMIGLATVHSWAGAKFSSPALALVPVYLFLILMAGVVAPLLAALGLLDHTQNLRRHFRAAADHGPPPM